MITDAGFIAIGVGLAFGLSALGTGMAEKDIGAAAVGAMAEDPKTFGKGLLFTVLPETVIVFGLLVAFLLMGKM